MEQIDLKHYFFTAVRIVRTNSIILWWLVLISICNTVSSLTGDSPISEPLKILSFIFSIVATPLIYGIYFELIENTYSSLSNIIKTYLLGYIWLLIKMYLPALFIAGLPMYLNPESSGEGSFYVILISFNLLYLYVIPLYFITRKQQGTIFSGITMLIKYISASTPIILAVLLVETIMLIFQYNKEALLKLNILFFSLLDFSVYIAASIIDFLIFIILILVLKHQLLETDDKP